jgi:hypothetical protein
MAAMLLAFLAAAGIFRLLGLCQSALIAKSPAAVSLLLLSSSYPSSHCNPCRRRRRPLQGDEDKFLSFNKLLLSIIIALPDASVAPS